MKILCVFGKYQYGDPSRGIGTEYAAFIPALKRLGHEVMHFDSWDRSRFADFSELNRELLKTVEEFRPDILLSVQLLYEIWLETLEIIKSRGHVATICWATDDSWKYRECSKFIGPAYHAMTTTYDYVVPGYHRDGIPHVLLTQWAANADDLRAPLPASACRYQVSFVGAAHGDRKTKIAELTEMGIDVACFGYGWPAGPVALAEIPGIMRESVISLNFANSKGINQIKARTFEVPGAGGFLLTEDAPGLDRFYVPGKEIGVFSGHKDLAGKIRHYLAAPELRDEIARRGFERTRRDHTYDVRMKELVDFALKARDEFNKGGSSIVSEPSLDAACQRHRAGAVLKLVRWLLVLPCIAVWGRARGPRAARRILFEISWRLLGAQTYSASGWPGRLFYKES
ncbi:MAG: glycosyltransferase [Gammaproteobacteria bacterium]